MDDDADQRSTSRDETEPPPKHLEVVRSDEAASAKASPKRRTATKKASWRAWTGTIEDLHKINKRFVDLALARREEIGRPWPEGYMREGKIEGLDPEAELVTMGDETVSGSFDAVVDELDPRTWAKLTLVAGDEWRDELHRLVLRRTPDSNGMVVDLTVKSADPATAASSLTRMSELVELGKPMWSWLHRSWVLPVLVAVTLMLFGAAILIPIYPWLQTQSHWSPELLVLIGVMVLAPVLFGLNATRLLRRFMPPSEIRYDHTPQSSGSRFIGALAALWVIPIVIGIIIAILIPSR